MTVRLAVVERSYEQIASAINYQHRGADSTYQPEAASLASVMMDLAASSGLN